MTTRADRRIVLVGNPNSGKSAIFNALTDGHAREGNWSGVTVDAKMGTWQAGDGPVDVMDLPGIYSLDHAPDGDSVDEDITLDRLESADGVIVNVVSATALERHLYLTTQLAEHGRKMIVVISMTDLARSNGAVVNTKALSQALGCPVIEGVAKGRQGIKALRREVERVLGDAAVPTLRVSYNTDIEALLRGATSRTTVLADATRAEGALERVMAIADARYSVAHQLAESMGVYVRHLSRDATSWIDSIALHKWMGLPIFLGVMYLMFMWAVGVGGALIDLFDITAGSLLVSGTSEALAAMGAPSWVIVPIADGLGGGIQVVLTFVPIIGALYLFQATLEESGYMARAAWVMDRGMRMVGLSGRAFVPLIMGFGCNVPAIMSARTLRRRDERIVTIAMAPFMSCGARLPVYALFAAAFFPSSGQSIVFVLYLIGIAAAIATALLLRSTVLKATNDVTLIELPRYQRPTIMAILRVAGTRLKGFVLGAGRIIVPMVFVINVLQSVSTSGEFDREAGDQSVLAAAARSITPAFAPMGLTEDNWPATLGLVTGILAKEVVVGTLDATYGRLAGEGSNEPGEWSFVDDWQEAIATVPANLTDTFGAWTDPARLDIGDVSSIEAAAEDQGTRTGTYGAMADRFDGVHGAFAYLLFVLLYMPCTAAIAAVAREIGPWWATFVALWTTGLGYAAGVAWYQASQLSNTPLASSTWLVGIAGALFGLWYAMARSGRKSQEATPC